MDSLENKNNFKFLLFGFLLIILDQATKLAIKGFDFFGFSHQGIEYGSLHSVIGDFVQITYIENPGMAFGISFGWGKIFLSLFSIVAGIALAVYLLRIKSAHLAVKIGITLLFAGAVGNLIDRVFYGVIFGEQALFYGYVVDFIQVDIPDIDFFGIFYTHFPVFNVADSCVTVGVVFLLFVHKHIPSIQEVFGKKNNNESSSLDNTNRNYDDVYLMTSTPIVDGIIEDVDNDIINEENDSSDSYDDSSSDSGDSSSD